MNQQPYDPPAEINTPLTQRSILHVIGFLFSGLVALLMLISAVFLAYQCYDITQQFETSWQGIPTYIILFPVVSFICAAIMAWSALHWHRRKAWPAITLFVLSMSSMFLAPRLLLATLY